MIVPYFNCLLIGHKYNQLEIDESAQEIIKDYLEEYLATHAACSISVTSLGVKNAPLVERVANIFHMLITNLSMPVYEVNNTYTLDEQLYARYQALKEISVKDGESHKTPAILENLLSLKKYYANYASDSQMKDFLKQLLVKEINHQRRCIVYRSANEVRAAINQEVAKITGTISISTQHSPSDDLVIVLVNQKRKQGVAKLEQLVRQVEKKFTVNKDINQSIAQHYTLKYLRNSASSQLLNLFKAQYKRKVADNMVQIAELKSVMKLIANLRVILQHAFRLAEEELKLQQQFIQFVSEMRAKYTNQMSKYFQTAVQLQKFHKQSQVYQQRTSKKTVIRNYLKGFSQYLKFQSAKKAKVERQCSMIQSRIKAFLINRRLYSSMMDIYLQKNIVISRKFSQYYRKIIALHNESELQKFNKYNRYKYGFTCCLFIIDIVNKTNCEQFQPSAILKLFERLVRCRQMASKIRCQQQSIQIHTIQGRMIALGEDIAQMPQVVKQGCSVYESNKQNSRSNSSFQSIIHQFDSQIKSVSSSRQISNSRNTNIPNSLKASINKRQSFIGNEPKQKSLKVLGKDYEFRLYQDGKLYGKGSNKHGQLGLECPQTNDFTPIVPFEKIKLVGTGDGKTIIMTASNKYFHFGKQKGRLVSSRTPVEFTMRDKFIAKQIVITVNEIYFLTNNNKIYSLQNDTIIRIPKEIQLGLEHFHLVKTGVPNLEVTYLIGYWVNTLDPIKRLEIEKYLTGMQTKIKPIDCQSMLVEQEKLELKSIHELSAIMEESISF